MSEEPRIYVLVAETVQSPVQIQFGELKPAPDTKSVTQPKGRIAAQVGHVVSRMRACRLTDMYSAWAEAGTRSKNMKHLEKLRSDMITESLAAYTTLIFGVQNSYELNFRHRLLDKIGLQVYSFYDENEEYGDIPVCTAICTEPTTRAKVSPALDYLPLWS